MNKSFELIPYLNKVSKLQEELESAHDINAQYMVQMNDMQELNTNLGQVFQTLNQIYTYLNTITNSLQRLPPEEGHQRLPPEEGHQLSAAPKEIIDTLQSKLESAKHFIDEGFLDYSSIFNEMLRIQSESELPTVQEAYLKSTQKLEAEKAVTAQLTQTVQNLEQQVAALQEELAEKRVTISAAEQRIQQTTGEKERLLAEKETLLLELEERKTSLENSEQRNQECESRVASLRTSVSALESDLGQETQRASECERDIQSLQESLEFANLNHANCAENYADLENENANLQKRIQLGLDYNTIEQQILSKQNELSGINRNIDRLERELSVKSRKLADLTNEISLKTIDDKNLLKRLDKNRDKLKQINAEITNITNYFNRAQIIIETKQKEQEDRQLALDNQTSEVQVELNACLSREDDLNEQVQSLNERLGALSREQNSLQELYAGLQVNLDESRARIAELSDRYTNVDQELSEKAAELSEKAAELEDSKRVYSDLLALKESIDGQLERTSGERDEFKRDSGAYYEDLQRTGAELEEFKSNYGALLAQKANLEGQMQQASAELDECKRNYSALLVEKGRLEGELNGAKKLNADLESKTVEVEKQLASCLEVKRSLTSQNTSLESTINHLRYNYNTELEASRKRNSELDDALRAVRARCSEELEPAFAASRASVESLELALAASRERIEGLESSLTASRASVADLSSNLSASRASVVSLESSLADFRASASAAIARVAELEPALASVTARLNEKENELQNAIDELTSARTKVLTLLNVNEESKEASKKPVLTLLLQLERKMVQDLESKQLELDAANVQITQIKGLILRDSQNEFKIKQINADINSNQTAFQMVQKYIPLLNVYRGAWDTVVSFVLQKNYLKKSDIMGYMRIDLFANWINSKLDTWQQYDTYFKKLRKQVLEYMNQEDSRNIEQDNYLFVSQYLRTLQGQSADLKAFRKQVLEYMNQEDSRDVEQNTYVLVSQYLINLRLQSADLKRLRRQVLEYMNQEDSRDVQQNTFVLVSQYLINLELQSTKRNITLEHFNSVLRRIVDDKALFATLSTVQVDPNDIQLNDLKRVTMDLLALVENRLTALYIQLGERKEGENIVNIAQKKTKHDAQTLSEWFNSHKYTMTSKDVTELENIVLRSDKMKLFRAHLVDYFKFIGPQLYKCTVLQPEIDDVSNWLIFYNKFFPNVDVGSLESREFTTLPVQTLKNNLVTALRRLGATVEREIQVGGALQSEGQNLVDEITVLSKWLREDYNVNFNSESLTQLNFTSLVNSLKTDLLTSLKKENMYTQELIDKIRESDRFSLENQKDIRIQRNQIDMYCQQLLFFYYYKLLHFCAYFKILQLRVNKTKAERRLSEESKQQILNNCNDQIEKTLTLANAVQTSIFLTLPIIRANIGNQPPKFQVILNNISDEISRLSTFIQPNLAAPLKRNQNFIYLDTNEQTKITNLFHAYRPSVALECIVKMGESESKEEPPVTTNPAAFMLVFSERVSDIAKHVVAKANVIMYELFMQYEPVDPGFYQQLLDFELEVTSSDPKIELPDLEIAFQWIKSLRPLQTKAGLMAFDKLISDEVSVPDSLKDQVVQELKRLKTVKYISDETMDTLFRLCKNAEKIVTSVTEDELANVGAVAQDIHNFLLSLEPTLSADVFFYNNTVSYQFSYRYQYLLVASCLLQFLRKEQDTTLQILGNRQPIQI